MIERLKALHNTRGQFANGSELFSACKSNEILKQEISALSRFYLNRTVAGCQNCYMDAYLELINLQIEKVMNKEKTEFRLRNGALLRDVVNQEIDLNCSNLNITNELALYHLKTNPGCQKLFEKLPDDVDEQLKNFTLPGEEKGLSDEEKAELERKQQEQETAERVFVTEVVELLAAGTTKKDIKANASGLEKIGHKKLTIKLLDELIKRADEQLKSENQNPPADDVTPSNKSDSDKEITV